MSRTVIILGAGASAQAGAPLMKDFLDRAEKVKAGDGYTKPDEAIQAFQLVFKALEALRHAHAKSKVDTRNVESVFAAFEMARLLGSWRGTLRLGQLRQHLKPVRLLPYIPSYRGTARAWHLRVFDDYPSSKELSRSGGAGDGYTYPCWGQAC